MRPYYIMKMFAKFERIDCIKVCTEPRSQWIKFVAVKRISQKSN